jgi:hypothetical protein
MVASRIHDQARYRRNLEVKVDPSGSSTVKMRARCVRTVQRRAHASEPANTTGRG